MPVLGNREILASVTERLYGLNVTCERWAQSGDGCPEYSFSARPESPETMKIEKLKRQRLATCPRRGETEFVMHCNIQPKGYRLYWLENQDDHRCCIGYVGPHLETKRHKAQ